MVEYKSVNWCPTYREFCAAAKLGKVRLGIMGSQYSWLYKEILPPSLIASVFRSYENRLIGKMIESEETFRRVHDHGIDLCLIR